MEANRLALMQQGTGDIVSQGKRVRPGNKKLLNLIKLPALTRRYLRMDSFS